MLQSAAKRIFGSRNEREIRRIRPIVDKVNKLEASLQGLSQEQLAAKTVEFKERLAKGAPLDSLIPEAFAVCREMSKRVLKMRHFDVQLIGGMVLHEGKVAEMKTGEGKTLVATLPVYLNALTGKGVHVVTVNDYLARRDSEWMGQLYTALGLTVGVIVHGLDDNQRRINYAADVTYGTNNEFGFDYLRDNMKFRLEDYVQREMNFAIVDEVDSILIDEARTPLIISGPAEESTDLYYLVDTVVRPLQRGHERKKSEMQAERQAAEEAARPEGVESTEKKGFFKKLFSSPLNDKPASDGTPDAPKEKSRMANLLDFSDPEEMETSGDFIIDEKARTVALTEQGVVKCEKALRVENIYDVQHIQLVHHIHQALKAHALFKRDVDYVVKPNPETGEGEVIIVDEFTGRLMPGRRFSDGLHQALEAKENVKIERENQTLATVTFQNYFRMYDKLSGMTGTADTEAAEFQKIYSLEVLLVPPNRPMLRKDYQDMVYKNDKAKFEAVANEIVECHKLKQPVLVGTISIEKSEELSGLLKRRGVPHNVLNAKHHEREAEIVANAGQAGAVTIATNMAGRGTDIVLGAGVPDLGGLHIIGTERHESRRIDNQLRGRSGRQGDPGSSRFYLCLEDNLLRIFQGERIKGYMDKLNIEEDVPIESKLISRAIENAQKKVEARNFDIRKHLLEYDDVMNKQREVVYEMRKLILSGENTRGLISDIIREQVENTVNSFAAAKTRQEWDTRGVLESMMFLFNNHFGLTHESIVGHESPEKLIETLVARAEAQYTAREQELGIENLRHLERYLYLGAIDQLWKDHLYNMDHLKEGVGLRGYGQKDPLVEFKKEGFTLFKNMDDYVKTDVISKLYRVQVSRQQEVEELQPKKQVMNFLHGDEAEVEKTPTKRDGDKVGRNDPCPCGSGKKYKKCHGQ